MEITIDCEKAQHFSDGTCLGYSEASTSDEPCEICKNCVKCQSGYYRLGEIENAEATTRVYEQKLRRGDKVVMHSCMEAEKNDAKIWVCETDSFKVNSGSEAVFLVGYSGYFFTRYLQKIDITEQIAYDVLHRR